MGDLQGSSRSDKDRKEFLPSKVLPTGLMKSDGRRLLHVHDTLHEVDDSGRK
jgi:hypothetical protein